MLKNAKFRLITAMLLFGTIGLFVRYIPLPSSVIALSRGVLGMLFLLAVLGFRSSNYKKGDVRK